MNNYNYLLKYTANLYGDRIEWPNNMFYKIEKEEIEEAEALLSFSFPSQLRNFYLTVGAGRIVVPHIRPNNYKFYSSNEILPPLTVANFYKGILFWEGQEYWMAQETYEFLEDGNLPFFEICDSELFLVMKIYSDNPNAVWDDRLPLKVSDSFEEFIFRLYYENPSFYNNVVEDYLALEARII